MENGYITHDSVSPHRTRGPGYHVVLRQFSEQDAEIVTVRLGPDDSLTGRRGERGATRKVDSKELMDEVTLGKSQQRAKRNVRIKCRSLQVNNLLTLTVRENITDIDFMWTVFKKFCRLMRKRYGEKFKYISVPEFQSRGAVHFHLAINGFFHANTVRRIWQIALGGTVKTPVGELGNVDFNSSKRIGKNSFNPTRIAQYLSKYITKQDSVSFNKRRYSSGGSIPPPSILKGWMSLLLNCTNFIFLDDILYSYTRRQSSTSFEVDGYFHSQYVST